MQLVDLLERVEWRFGVALAIGLLAGAERERRKADTPGRPPAGVRTFALAALLGAVLGQIDSPVLWAAGLVVVGGIAALAYFLGDRSDPGITTEIALVVVFALGLLAQSLPLPALGAGVVASMLLAMRGPLHRFVREVLSARDLVDALAFALAAVVILPLLPDRAIDPWGSINPFVLWRLAVLVMALTAVGYIALRWAGPRYGLFIAGLAGGLVSSAATIASMGGRARQDAALNAATVAGAAASTISTFLYLALLLAVANPALGIASIGPLAAGGVTALAFALAQARRADRTPSGAPPEGRAFRWRTAVGFAVLVSLITLVSVLLQQRLGHLGVLVGAAAAGFADVHAATSALAAMALDGTVTTETAQLGLLMAISTNTATKLVLALSSGPRPYGRRVALGLLLVLAAVWAASLLAR